MYFEDFKPGLHTTTPSRMVTGEELDAFLDIAELHLPMFLDDASAQELGHSRRLVTGPMILAIAMGLVRATGWFDQVIAGLAFNNMRFLKAVHPDDTLQANITVIETRPTKNPHRGLVVIGYEVTNQAGIPVLVMEGTYLFRRMQEG